MQVNGACHCGALAWRAEVDPATVSLCNCTDCQVLSGSPFRWSVVAREGTFAMVRGTPTIYVKTADSGRQREQAFCPTCGAQVYATSPGPEPKTYGLRIGALAQRNELEPRRRIWMRSAQSWLAQIGALPGAEKA